MKRVLYSATSLILIAFYSAAAFGQTPGVNTRGMNPSKALPPQLSVAKDASSDDSSEGKDSEASSGGNTAEINVKNAEIASVIRIFSKKTKRNYILDERVKGKVSIYLPGKVTPEESLKILDSVLGLKGFTAVPLGENLWKVIPSKEAKQSTIPTLKDDTSGSGSSSVVTKILNLKYIAADEAKEIVSQLVSPDGLVSAYGGTNALLIIDYEDNVNRLVGIIDTVDVPFSNREMTIIPVLHADSEDVAKKLQEILGIGNDSKDAKGSSGDSGLDLIRARMRDSANNAAPPPGGQPAAVNAGGANAGAQQSRTTQPKIISDERTNSIIVVADDDTTARVRALISQLDSEVDLSGQRFYVYRCQHANAEELAEVLAGLAGQGSSGSKSSGSNILSSGGGDQGEVSVNTNSRNRGNQFDKTQSRLSGQRRTPGRSRTENGNGSGGPSSVQLGENLSITADKATNSLIISAGKSDYEKIKELLKQLDIKRRQVLVEAMILEVAVDDQSEYGTDWLTSGGGADGGFLAKSDFGNTDQSLASVLSNPAQMSKFSVAAASQGTLSLPGGIKIPSQAVLLTAAQSNSNVNVLSSPNLLTTDNEEAEIVVGQNVPFLASRSTSDANLNNTFNQIDRQDVGITLRLTPQISSQSFVTMKIFTEVSSVVNQTDLGPTTAVRTSETTVIAKDGQMVVTGGLLADTSNDSDAGVPFLKDIPVLGYAFKSGNRTHQKTNLLIFMTPRIVRDQFDHRDLTIEHRDEMEGEIAARGVYPDRSEVLESNQIDKVTEAESYDGPKPSTILPPTKPEQESSSSDATFHDDEIPVKPSVSHQPPTDSPGVIQLKVAPKLPPPGGKSDEPKGMLKESSIAPSGRFYVMSLAQKDKKIDGVPFSPEQQGGMFGIEVPEGSSAAALQFFKQNGAYQYEGSTGEVPVTVVGSFASRQEAQGKFSGTSLTWYTLSPFEVMSLGKSLWTKR